MREQLIKAGLWDAANPGDPSVSIECAWEVVEKIRETYGVVVWIGSEGVPGQEWRAMIGTPDPNVFLPEAGPDVDEVSATAPLAICLAALKFTASMGGGGK